MRLLLFSDLHGDPAAAWHLVELSQQADVVVGAGDFCYFGRDLSKGVNLLRDITKPCVFVAGNHETTEELREICSSWPQVHILHGSGVQIDGIEFFGIGGAVPVTPFGLWSYDFTEEQAAELLRGCPAKCVLVSHSPPKGAADLSSQGQSLGSIAIREIVVRQRPRLVVCGHIHGSGGQKALVDETPVVNAGHSGIEWVLE